MNRSRGARKKMRQSWLAAFATIAVVLGGLRKHRARIRWKHAGLGLLATLALVLTSLTGVVVTTTRTAAAASISTGLGQYDTSYAVTTTSDGTMYGVCAEHGKATPTTVGGDWSDPAAYWTGDASTLSWLGSEFGRPGTPTWRDPAGTVLTKDELDGGIAWVAAHRFQVFGTNGGETGATQGASYGGIITLFITANPGPWTITKVGPNPGSPYGTGGEGYSGTFYVESSTHHPVSDVPLAVSGVALESTSEWGSSTNADGTHSWTSTAPPTGETAGISVSVAGTAPSTHGVVLYAPSSSNAQALLAFATTGRTSLSFTVSTSKATTSPVIARKGNLTIVKKDASGGSNLAGAVFHVTGPTGYATTATIPATGSKTLLTLNYGAYGVLESSPPPGWSLTPTPQTEIVGSTGTAPPVSPTVTFSDSPLPAKMTTSDPTAFARPGAVLTDTFTVSTLPTNAALNGGAADSTTVAWGLDGPVALGQNGTCASATFGTAPRFQTGTSQITGNGTYTAGPANAVTVAGCYGWAETVPADAYTAGVSSGPTASGEQSYVTPTITTVAHTSKSTVGATLADTATVTGITGESSVITYAVYGPTGPTPAGTCPTTPVAWKTAAKFSSGTLPVATSGTFKLTASPSVTVAGCYSWVESLASTATPPAYTTVSTTVGTSLEASYLAPVITTVAHASKSTTGATLTDTAAVAGITGLPSTIAYTVYGPTAPTTAGTCPTTSTAWNSAAKFASGSLGVTKSGTYLLTAIPAATVAGCYSWVETLTSTATPPAYTTVSTTVGTSLEAGYLAPIITTVAHVSQATAAATLTDTATVTGITGLASTIGYTVWGPVAENSAAGSTAGSCPVTSAAWKTAAKFATGSLAVTKSDTVTLTASPDVTAAGCYSWVESLASTNTPPAYTTVSTMVGTSLEADYLAPTITTVAHASKSTVGATLTDTATVTGVGNDPSTIAWKVLGPQGTTCPKTHGAWAKAPVFATGSLAITADGTYTITAPPKVSVPGCYSWVETLSSVSTPPLYGPVSTPGGTAKETILILETVGGTATKGGGHASDGPGHASDTSGTDMIISGGGRIPSAPWWHIPLAISVVVLAASAILSDVLRRRHADRALPMIARGALVKGGRRWSLPSPFLPPFTRRQRP